MTPDGVRYLTMAQGQAVALPFHLRWAVPALCRTSIQAWTAVTWSCAVLAAAGTAVLGWQHGLDPAQAVAAGLLWAGLPSVRFATRRPVLVDTPTVAAAVVAAVAAGIHPALGIATAVVAGCVNERAPVWAALFAWSAWPLLGLLAPLWRLILTTPGPDPLKNTEAGWAAANPLQAGLRFHAGQWRNPLVMVAPWGGCLVALVGADWHVAACVALGYLQLVVATDTVRLYQQAAPIVCVAAVAVCPPALLPLLVVAHWCNPWAGNGV